MQSPPCDPEVSNSASKWTTEKLPSYSPSTKHTRNNGPIQQGLVKSFQLDCRWGGSWWEGWEVTELSRVPVPVHAVLLHWWANYQQTKPCWLLGGFCDEAGEITIVTGDEELASESPAGKRQQLPQRRDKIQIAEKHPSYKAGEKRNPVCWSLNSGSDCAEGSSDITCLSLWELDRRVTIVIYIIASDLSQWIGFYELFWRHYN